MNTDEIQRNELERISRQVQDDRRNSEVPKVRTRTERARQDMVDPHSGGTYTVVTEEKYRYLENELNRALAEVEDLKAKLEKRRPFSDKLAEEVIAGQVKTIMELESKCIDLRGKREKIKEECEGYADGVPDASPRDQLANRILGLISGN